MEPPFHRFPIRARPRLGSTTEFTEDIHHKGTKDTKTENFTAKAAKAAKTDLFKTEGNEGLTKESVLFRFSGFIVVSFRIGIRLCGWPLLCKFSFSASVKNLLLRRGTKSAKLREYPQSVSPALLDLNGLKEK